MSWICIRVCRKKWHFETLTYLSGHRSLITSCTPPCFHLTRQRSPAHHHRLWTRPRTGRWRTWTCRVRRPSWSRTPGPRRSCPGSPPVHRRASGRWCRWSCLSRDADPALGSGPAGSHLRQSRLGSQVLRHIYSEGNRKYGGAELRRRIGF